MTDRPILFSAPMVRALLEGRKTQTRRVIEPQPQDILEGQIPSRLRISTGDRLWVREAHAIVGSVDPGYVLYRADGYEAECERHGFDKPFPPESDARWRPSIHMPRWASRLTLEVIDVRVERLQDISEQDAIAEGIYLFQGDGGGYKFQPGEQEFDTAVEAYRDLWSHINGPDAWDTNPWIAAYTFHVINRNVDRLQAPQTGGGND